MRFCVHRVTRLGCCPNHQVRVGDVACVGSAGAGDVDRPLARSVTGDVGLAHSEPALGTVAALLSVADLLARLGESSGEPLHYVTGNGKHELAGLNVRRVRVGFFAE
jgi:hypothetical protein